MNSYLSASCWLLMLALVSLSYDTSTIPSLLQEKAEPEGLLPRQRQWSQKAVERYAQSQEIKWRRWRDTMYRPKP